MVSFDQILSAVMRGDNVFAVLAIFMVWYTLRTTDSRETRLNAQLLTMQAQTLDQLNKQHAADLERTTALLQLTTSLSSLTHSVDQLREHVKDMKGIAFRANP